VPPNTITFDPSNTQPILNPARSFCGPGAATKSAPGDDSNSRLATSALEALVETLRRSQQQPTMPQTPVRRNKHVEEHFTPSEDDNNVSSPRRPTDLLHFLKYAKRHCGVEDAELFLSPLRKKGFAPDILGDPDIKIEDLTGYQIGMTHGDAIRLHRAAPEWHKNRNKRRREADIEGEEDEEDNPFLRAPAPPGVDDSNIVGYKAVHPDGEQRWFGSPLIPEPGPTTYHGSPIMYQDVATGGWHPIPEGFSMSPEAVPLEDR